eukprot:TRINITY_DN13476_c0_g1_i4.p1 TRINITY_DN13476_c0_g1~~TRINITY_DN13476_c0_g1_i4.p1  ORF type:complete len:292 (+),score=67.53 TRINITY_DN13476_c0_g1_i4:52-927(+)
MCIRDRYQRRVRGLFRRRMAGARCLLLLAATALAVRADGDDKDYEYDPFDDQSDDPDMEGSIEPPKNIWHACRFGAKKGGIFDLRALSRNEQLLRAHYRWGGDHDIETEDWVHQDVTQYNVTYYLNVCADVIELPEACKKLKKVDPAPAYQVTNTGQCKTLGFLKTFKWKPIDTHDPEKGMILVYKNGDKCDGNRRSSLRMIFTCSRGFDSEAGPMVVYQRDSCNYDVVWPSQYGCPSSSALQQLGLQNDVGKTSSTGKWVFGVVVLLAICACAGYFWQKRDATVGAYSSL